MFEAVLGIPQWQGTAGLRQYRQGHALCRQVLASFGPAIHDLAIPAEEPVWLRHGILAHDALVRNYRQIQAKIRQLSAPLFTLGGDCSVDFVPIAEVLARHGDEVGLVWIDTHPDLNTPACSVSRHFHGMLVRALFGETPSPELRAFVMRSLQPRQLFYVAPHDIDPGEAAYIKAHGVFVLPHDAPPAELVAALRQAGITKVHLHLDLDVMDPEYFPHVATPVPGGLRPEAVVALLATLSEQFTVVGGEVSEMSPSGVVRDEHLAILQQIFRDGFGF